MEKLTSILGGVGGTQFTGTTKSSQGGFGAGFSPMNFNTVTTEIPGAAITTLK
jgi:hypothetical protein